MVNVAIAGGNGSIGRTIVEVLNTHPHHDVFVLTRNVRVSSGLSESNTKLIRTTKTLGTLKLGFCKSTTKT